VKTILLIFSVYLLLLPGISCAGADNCSDEIESSVTKASGHDEQEKEDCGNFCSCSCCVHIVSVNFQLSVISIDKPIGESVKHSFYHNISLPSNYFGNIWQPPKMS
jgi:hypothetical protein